MTKKLISLEEFNKSRLDPQKIPGNGIACPMCGSELVDIEIGKMLASKPPRARVHCSTCDWDGYRIA